MSRAKELNLVIQTKLIRDFAEELWDMARKCRHNDGPGVFIETKVAAWQPLKEAVIELAKMSDGNATTERKIMNQKALYFAERLEHSMNLFEREAGAEMRRLFAENLELKLKVLTQDMDTSMYGKAVSLRDHFAGLAMQGLLASPNTTDPADREDAFAEQAYRLADAMLKAREEA